MSRKFTDNTATSSALHPTKSLLPGVKLGAKYLAIGQAICRSLKIPFGGVPHKARHRHYFMSKMREHMHACVGFWLIALLRKP